MRHAGIDNYDEDFKIDVIRFYLENDLSMLKTADKFNISKSSIERWKLKYGPKIKQQTKEKEALAAIGLNEDQAKGAVINNLSIDGTSRYYKTEDGGVWIKTKKEHQNLLERFERIGQSMIDGITPRPAIHKPQPYKYEDILSCYVLSDFHLGMYSSFDPDGYWDTKIAESVLYKWIDMAVDQSKESKDGLFIQLGDFFHANDHKGITPRSGHVLDIDTCWDDVIDIGMAALEYAFELMLKKHDNVHCIIAEANHDPDAAKWMQRWFERLYRDNPRISFDLTKGGYYAYQWHDNAIFAHHGHARGINDVSKALTAMYPQVYGNSKHRYAHIGHFHHAKTKPFGDDGLMEVKIHKTLAAKDQHAATRGYISKRGATTAFYHKYHGYIGESNITPSMLM